MVKLPSVVLLFVIILYCLLTIYKGILMSAKPMAAHCQHMCKCFALYAVIPHIKLFSPINTDVVC